MQHLSAHIDELIDTARDYVENRAESARLKAVDKISDTVSTFTGYFIIGGFLCVIVILINLALALLVGEWLGKAAYGFLAVAGVNGILALLLYLFRDKWIKTPVYNQMVKKLANLEGET